MSEQGRSYLIALSMLVGFVVMLSSGCKDHCYDGEKNQDEEALDCGGISCIPCDSTVLVPPEETCFDGIQNQDETGVDCGGVCLPCQNDTTVSPPDTAQLCGGDGSTQLLPLAVGNFWHYTSFGTSDFSRTITSTASIQGQTYFRVESTGSSMAAVEYIRADGSGNYYRLEADMAGNPVGVEYLYINGAAGAGIGWTVPGLTTDSITTIAVGASLNSANTCSYSNVSTYKELYAGFQTAQRSHEPGVGVVDWVFNVSAAYLDSVALY